MAGTCSARSVVGGEPRGVRWLVAGQMAEYVDGDEKAPLSSSAGGGAAGRRAPPQKPDWTRFGLQSAATTGDDTQGSAAAGRAGGGDDDAAGEVNEIYAEHEVLQPTSHSPDHVCNTAEHGSLAE